ncbi:hypothetical protein [Cypionkella sp.]|uniref:hypothetical protein n=1 Tax=Cypionkella sp. TaxID=2811411 RepID=UPI002AC95D9D|nr:hypothetical protein [Cypionkella sp.]
MMFEHTSKEKGLWRGWLKNGQSVEVSWGKRGWDFGAGVHIHGNDDDMGDRMLCVKVWRLAIYLPLGIVQHPWPAMEGPQWSTYASREFGLTFSWGLRRKSFDWPWAWHTVAYEVMMPNGTWEPIRYSFDEGGANSPYKEVHPYTYNLRNGTVQNRMATITKRRRVMTWRAFKALGWPRWIKESIDIQFDGEVGERSGSWKGGCVGCSYDLRADETMGAALRRMEQERKF